ncbi:imidazolonepropionase [Dokdonella koreensis]|uniref:Imidazolonepropionase n=1 Tax=Dokdonella koreensis DS-123 TaxID=1300342 RepID=A0A160DTH1_9GAMM|nr:imidazolonepropionase [Dokdonella koreensis]ANB17494.1 Imidazolonepropionase [Dokdonella koreensis DS-123]
MTTENAGSPTWDGLLLDARLATLADTGQPYGAIEDAALGWKDGHIVYAGPMAGLPDAPHALSRSVESAGRAWITPGLVDCHTHLVFGGDRAHEFELRLGGASYEAIARAGGGIASTVCATRAADEDALLAPSLGRARRLIADGATTLEIKSGYGLDLASERKMLRVARRIGAVTGASVRTTFLGAHALPPEFAGQQDAYVDHLCETMLPAIAAENLADAVDAFCESIAFTPAQTRRVFERACALGLPVKLHADQLSDLGGAALSAEFGGLSADHIEHTGEAGVRAMAAAGTVAVLLPGAFYALRDTQLPPIEALRRHGVPMAVASDLNPGTSPLLSLRLAMNLACTLFRLTPEEALRGATVQAARALGLADRGRLAPGLRADFALWPVERPAELCYWIGGNLAAAVYAGGVRLA